ncbi:MAG: AMP-binding protein [Proteobacteria bacterium]|nr:AMP-binding protein [Pseudomonadota bacterium]
MKSLPIDVEKNWGELPKIFDRGIETLPQLLVYQAGRFGDRVFHRKKDFGIWQRFTFKDVLDNVRQLAMGLSALGVTRGETVGLVGENEPELFWSEYASQAIGCKCVCLYPDFTPPQMEYLLNHSEAVVLICEDQEQVDKVLEIEDRLPRVHRVIYWDDKGMWKYDHPKLMTFGQVQELGRAHDRENPGWFEAEVASGKGDDMAVISYTSGTTGLPKGCIMTHTGLFDTAFRVAGTLPIRPFTQYLSYISPAWAAEQMGGLTQGLLVPFVVNFPEEPETVTRDLREIGTEAVVFTPRQWESLASLVESKMMDAGPIRRWFYRWGMSVGRMTNLARLEGRPIPPLYRLLHPLAEHLVLYPLRDNLGLQDAYYAQSGGSGMAPDVFRFFHTMGVKLRNVYGTTEMGMFTSHMGETYDLETVGMWDPVHPRFGPPLEYKLTEEGELLVRGGAGFAGYYNNPEATEKRMAGGWYHTGDALHMTDKGEMVYLDRLEDMRKLSTGHSYPPQFIENRLRFSPFIKEVMTLGDESKPFVAAMINIDIGTVGPWAEQRSIGYTTFTDLSQNARVRELIREEVAKVNYFLPAGSKVTRFFNLPKELDPDEDELTRSRKIRRSFLEQKYADFIGAVYQGREEFSAVVPVKYQDGRTGTLNATVHIVDLGPEEG